MSFRAIFGLILLFSNAFALPNFRVEDVFVPDACEVFVNPMDHVLVEYEVLFANGSHGTSVKAPNQLFHIQIDSSANDDSLVKALKGMCLNSKRKFIWENAMDSSMAPFLTTHKKDFDDEEDISLVVTAVHITSAEDYRIFDAFKSDNISLVLDLIEEHKGVNSFDEWGQTPLMIAVNEQQIAVISALLNARMPKVDVNLAKSSGYTALTYSVQKANVGIVQALLRRGADPNIAVLQEGSRGNTPLHYACLLEKPKHAQLLLDFGANPMVKNQYNMSPAQLIPADAVRSIRMLFKEMFEAAYIKYQNEQKNQISSGAAAGVSENSARQDI